MSSPCPSFRLYSQSAKHKGFLFKYTGPDSEAFSFDLLLDHKGSSSCTFQILSGGDTWYWSLGDISSFPAHSCIIKISVILGQSVHSQWQSHPLLFYPFQGQQSACRSCQMYQKLMSFSRGSLIHFLVDCLFAAALVHFLVDFFCSSSWLVLGEEISMRVSSVTRPFTEEPLSLESLYWAGVFRGPKSPSPGGWTSLTSLLMQVPFWSFLTGKSNMPLFLAVDGQIVDDPFQCSEHPTQPKLVYALTHMYAFEGV